VNIRTKLLWKTLAILTPIEFGWFGLCMFMAYYVNDFLGRSLAGAGFILIPLFGSYWFMLKELDNAEDVKYRLFLEQEAKKNKKGKAKVKRTK
jgi:hypothetical protein